MNKLLLLACVPPILLAAWMGPRLEPYLVVEDDYTQSEMQAAKESIALSLMGQLQFTMGDLLWMKSQEYLHGGLIYRMPTKSEEALGYIPRDSVGTSEGLSHSEGILMAPEEERDWRGILGKIDREIVPHAEHMHEDPVELIPWYQLVVKFNPHQERVYSMAAFFMSDSAESPGDALAFLHKGLDANPWSWELRAGIGRLLHDYANKTQILATRKGESEPIYDEIVPKTEEDAYEMAAEILGVATKDGLKDRVELAQRREVFDDYQKQLFRESYLMLAKSLTELQRWDEALEACYEGFEVSKHNHLKVQARTIKRDMRERGLEPPPDPESMANASAKPPVHDHVHVPVNNNVRKKEDKDDDEDRGYLQLPPRALERIEAIAEIKRQRALQESESSDVQESDPSEE